MAVPLALVLVVALGLLGAGALVLAQREAVTAPAAVDWTRGRLVARGMVRTFVTSPSADSLPDGPLWSSTSLVRGRSHGTEHGVDARRLGPEWRLFVGWVLGRPGTARMEEGLLVWTLDPVARVAAVDAVLVHGDGLSLSADAAVDGGGLLAAGEGGPAAACAPWMPALDSVFPTGRLAPALRDPRPDSRAPLPALGLLGPEALKERLPDRVAGTVEPAPVWDAGGCRAGPANWGSPTDPEGPCGERRVALVGSGDVVVQGGEGQGLLLVEGSLTLTDGAAFAGLVVVRDTLRLGAGTRITGLVRSGGPAILESGAEVRGRACPPLLALEAAPALSRPLPAPGGAWIRPF